jgi:hypothetical protein
MKCSVTDTEIVSRQTMQDESGYGAGLRRWKRCTRVEVVCGEKMRIGRRDSREGSVWVQVSQLVSQSGRACNLPFGKEERNITHGRSQRWI